jgi:hypothetical protein
MVGRHSGPADSLGNREDWARPEAFSLRPDRPLPGEEARREASEVPEALLRESQVF